MSFTDTSSKSHVVPTLAIGVGMGGLKIIRELITSVQANGDIDNYRFIALDSNIDDLKKNIGYSPNTSLIEITDHQYDVGNLQRDCPYIYEGVKIQAGGALRERVYGRFLLDLHRSRIQQTLSTYIIELVNLWKEKGGSAEKKGHMCIWLVHSLGGGTGSGSFPALLVYLQKIIREILIDANKGVVPHIYGVGILPSGTNVADITTATFNKKYLANSFAALKEIQVLANASKENPVILNPFTFSTNNEPISVIEKPFERYFFFGINEEKISDMEKTKNPDDGNYISDEDKKRAEKADDYLSHSNKIIVNLMHSIPQYPKGLDNLWLDIKSPIIVFGESELIFPIRTIKRLAKENDLLGKESSLDSEKKLTLQKEAVESVKNAFSKGGEQYLEEKCIAIFNSHRLRGLSYFAGKLQNEMNKYHIAVESNYENSILKMWETLGDESWSGNEIADSQATTFEERHKVIVHLLQDRIEEIQKNINSILTNPLKKPSLKEKIGKIQGIIDELQRKRTISDKSTMFKQFLDAKIGEGLEITSGKKYQKPYGIAPIVECIRRREAAQKYLIERLEVSGGGRLLKVTIPQSSAEDLTLIKNEINVSNLMNIPDFLKILAINSEEMDKIVNSRVDQAKDLEIQIATVSRRGQDQTIPSEQLWILCNKANEPALAGRTALASIPVEKISDPNYDLERVIFLDIKLNHQIEDFREFTNRKTEYENGKLKEKAEIKGPIGTLFAYPEWFPQDPEIRAAFPKMYGKS